MRALVFASILLVPAVSVWCASSYMRDVELDFRMNLFSVFDDYDCECVGEPFTTRRTESLLGITTQFDAFPRCTYHAHQRYPWSAAPHIKIACRNGFARVYRLNENTPLKVPFVTWEIVTLNQL